MDRGSKEKIIFVWNQEFKGKIAVFREIMTISIDLAISSSMSSFVPKYWLKWKILLAFSSMNLVGKDGTIKVYIPVHP